MNILVFSWRDPKNPLAGGAEQVMHEHMKGWIDKGHQVTLFTAKFTNCANEENLEGIRIIRRGSPLHSVYLLAVYWYLFENKNRFDLIVDQFHGIPFLTPLYIRPKKVAVIQEVAKEVWFLNHLPFPFNYLYGILGIAIEPIIFIFYRNTPFITGSESAKSDVFRMGIPKKNITIIPHGVIGEKIVGLKKEKVSTVLFLGALAKDKGIEDAISTFAILNHLGKYNFWIVGKGADIYIIELKKKVKELGISKNTKFWGFVSNKKKFELLARSHILINPSIREGWGLVNIEANLVKTPVVAYRSQGLIDSVKNGVSGILCSQNTPKSLAENVEKIIKNRKLLNKLQVGSLKWARQFSWDSSKEKSNKFIERIALNEK